MQYVYGNEYMRENRFEVRAYVRLYRELVIQTIAVAHLPSYFACDDSK